MSVWEWRGDLNDDCTAIGHGLMLRAEQMDTRCWWWAVYDADEHSEWKQLAASYDFADPPPKSGKAARREAESFAAGFLYTRN